MTRTYQNLILGLGNTEGAKATEMIVGGNFDEGFPTPREALEHFRSCIRMLCVQDAKHEERGEGCSYCEMRIKPEPLNRYCGFCGKSLKYSGSGEPDYDAQAADRFRKWFDLEMHEFRDWEELANQGWQVGWLSTGGFVRLDDFAVRLEDWNPDDWEDHTSAASDRTWWEDLLSDCTLGEITLDGGDSAS